MKIGFIGLGIMGSRMAANLLSADVELVVFNRTPAKTAPLAAQGANVATSMADFAEVDILFTMLAHPDAVTAVSLGKNGFLNHLQLGTLWVDCSTVTPSFSQQMSDESAIHKVQFLEAPVAGSKPHAANGDLVFFVGGASENVEKCTPFFNRMGRKVVHVGTHGMGTALKVVVNALLATSMATFAEMMALGQALGLSQEMLLNVLIGGPVVPPFMGMKRANIEQNMYDDPDFPLQWMFKDLHMATIAAYETAVPTPVTQAAQGLYALAIQDGLGEADFSAIYQYLNGVLQKVRYLK